MKIVRVKYIPPYPPMIADLQRVFPQYTINGAFLAAQGGILIDSEKKRFVYIKEFLNEDGTRKHAVVYMLARDSFQMPAWIQGQELNEIDLDQHPIDHFFMGHEIPVPDDPNEEPDDEIL